MNVRSKMRGLLALGAAAAVVLPFAACGSSSANTTTISFYSYFAKNQIGTVVDDFEKANPDIKLDVSYGQNPSQYVQTLQTRLAGGKPPTVFNLTMDNRTDVMNSGAAMDLKNESFTKGIDPANFQPFQQDGKTYGMPVTAWFSGMFYNKKILAAAGYKTLPASWDEFIAMSKKIDASGKTAYLEDFNSQPSPSLAGLLGSSYGKKNDTNPDNDIWTGKATFSENWKEAVNEWDQGIKEGAIPQKSIGVSGDQIKNEFVSGNLAVYRSGPWDISDLAQSGIDYGVAPMPAVKGAKPWITGGPDQGFAIAAKASAKEQAAGKKFLTFLNSKQGLKDFTSAAGTVSLSSKYSSTPAKEIASLVNDYLKKNHAYWINWGKSPTAMSTTMIAEQQQLVQGKITTSQFLKALDDKWKTL